MISINPKLYLLLAGIALFPVLAVTAYLVDREIQPLKDKISEDKKLIVWIAQASGDINMRRHFSLQKNEVKPASLLSLIDKEAKVNSWAQYPMDMKQGENAEVAVTFSRINFDDLMTGLEDLWQKHEIEVSKINVKRIESGHFVTAALVLKL